MCALEHLLVGRQRELAADQVLRLALVGGKGSKQKFGVGVLKVVGALLLLVL